MFSAPKYCDSTENRGAYINVGPDYKLKYEQFDAVPHPDIKPMVRPITTTTRYRRETNAAQAYAHNSLMSSLM